MMVSKTTNVGIREWIFIPISYAAVSDLRCSWAYKSEKCFT